jgi:hypothetical protein
MDNHQESIIIEVVGHVDVIRIGYMVALVDQG